MAKDLQAKLISAVEGVPYPHDVTEGQRCGMGGIPQDFARMCGGEAPKSGGQSTTRHETQRRKLVINRHAMQSAAEADTSINKVSDRRTPAKPRIVSAAATKWDLHVTRRITSTKLCIQCPDIGLHIYSMFILAGGRAFPSVNSAKAKPPR